MTPDEPDEPSFERASMTRILDDHGDMAKVLRERYERRVAVLFSDIAGSTAFFDKHGDVMGRMMIQRHNELLFPVIDRIGGRVVKTIGDAIMASFPTSSQAVEAAVEMQLAIERSNLRAKRPEDVLVIRIGVHAGAALLDENDGDLYGDTVNVAARVQSKADIHQVLVSPPVYEELSRSGRAFRQVGSFTLKGKRERLKLYAVDWLGDRPKPAFTQTGELPKPRRLPVVAWALPAVLVVLIAGIAAALIARRDAKPAPVATPPPPAVVEKPKPVAPPRPVEPVQPPAVVEEPPPAVVEEPPPAVVAPVKPKQPKPVARPVGKPGTLTLSLDDAWVDVFIDGTKVGTTPDVLSMQLSPGEHEVFLQNPRRGTQRATVVIRSGRETKLKVVLRNQGL